MSIDHAGFADPVLDAQRAFRALLDAMSRPGTVHRIGALPEAPRPLGPAAAAVLLTLLDADTPLWLAPAFASSLEWLVFHTGVAATGRMADASYVVTTQLPDLTGLNAGSDAGPEDSATLIVQIASIGAAGAPAWRLAGPGLAGPRILSVDGLPHDFAARWAANRALFPRGVDLVLCADDTLVALPRTTQISEL